MHTYKIITVNADFWQRHEVTAATEERAIQLAVEASNDLAILRDEAMMAEDAGLEPGGRYSFWEVLDAADATGEEECVTFRDSGGNG